MKTTTILLIVLFIGNVFGQVNKSDKISNEHIRYYQDFLNFADGNKSRLDIFIQVPLKEIQFVKSENGYEGGYSVTVTLYEEDKTTLVQEKVWNESIKIESFNYISSRENFNLSHRSFVLPSKKYYIRTVVTDKDSRQEFSSENFYTVKDFSIKPSMSDIMLISNKTVVNGNNKIVPNVSRNITDSENGIEIFYEVYSDSAETIELEYIISNDADEDVIYSETKEQELKAGTTQIFYTFLDSALSLGTYHLSVYTKEAGGDSVLGTTKKFFSRLAGLPSNIVDIDKAIAQMVYIASPEEINNMEDGKDEKERTKRFLVFWKGKDPSPGNEQNEVFEEYFRRIDYCNKNFSQYMEGWKTDRGMVYIILGSPNNIDRHPFEYDSKPYEVWQYYELNRSFVFVDETGFGDYRLTTPLYGDLFRYRY